MAGLFWMVILWVKVVVSEFDGEIEELGGIGWVFIMGFGLIRWWWVFLFMHGLQTGRRKLSNRLVIHGLHTRHAMVAPRKKKKRKKTAAPVCRHYLAQHEISREGKRKVPTWGAEGSGFSGRPRPRAPPAPQGQGGVVGGFSDEPARQHCRHFSHALHFSHRFTTLNMT